MKTFACVVSILLFAFAYPASAQQSQIDDNPYHQYVTALPTADKVEVLLVAGVKLEELKDVDCTKPDVICKPPHGLPVRIVAAKTLTGEEANIISLLWRRLQPGNGAGCFSPAYLLRFSTREQVFLSSEVCFYCCNITLPGKGIISMCGNNEALIRFKEFVTTMLPYTKGVAKK